MSTDVTSIHTGMDVYAMDGQKLGTVAEVRPPVSAADGAEAGRADPGAADVSAGVAGGTAGSSLDAGGGDLGTVISGATTDKDRGVPTGIAHAARQDVRTFPGQLQGVTPDAGGGDVIRGYGMEHGGTTDTDPRGSAASATGNKEAPGSAGMAPNVGEAGGAGAWGATIDTATIGGGTGAAMDATSPGTAGDRPAAGGGAASEGGYFTVRDPGFLGVGGRALRVPFNAVHEVVPGRGVTLACTSDECHRRYGGRVGLDLDEDAPVER